MTISISKTALLNKLQQLSKIIPSKPSLFILENYLFETKEGRLFITASNSEGRITTSLDCITDEDISICIPTSIVEGLKTLPEQPIIIFINTENKEIQIKYSGGKFVFMGLESVSYPSKPILDSRSSISMPAYEFYNGIAKVVSFAANDELRPVICTVFIEASSDSVTFVGTDGHGLGYVTQKGSCSEKTSVTISRSIASILKGLIPASDENLNIEIGADWSGIKFDDLDVSFRNVEGRYPNWKVVVPKNNDKKLIVDTKQLIGAIKRTIVFSSKMSSLIVLSMESGELTVSAQDIDFSTSAEEKLPVDFDGKKFAIGVKGTLIQEMLSYIDDDRTVLTFSIPEKAILIMPEKQQEGRELTYLLMPMTIQ